jgi:ATP-binding protein involved in chromosome partitioning
MISMAVLAPPDKPMILRGPMLHGVVRQFLIDVKLGRARLFNRRYAARNRRRAVILAQLVPVQGAVLVTTPQSVSIADVLPRFENV